MKKQLTHSYNTHSRYHQWRRDSDQLNMRWFNHKGHQDISLLVYVGEVIFGIMAMPKGMNAKARSSYVRRQVACMTKDRMFKLWQARIANTNAKIEKFEQRIYDERTLLAESNVELRKAFQTLEDDLS